MPKPQTSPCEDVMIFLDITLCNGLQEGNTGFQFFELEATESSMALTYENLSDKTSILSGSLCG
jgi:hypothetical protein